MSKKLDERHFNKTQFFIRDTNESIRGNYSDGYHTFNELYEHRIRLFIELCRSKVTIGKLHSLLKNQNKIWVHVENESDQWFLMGINTEAGKQITYHLPARFWNEVCEFAEVLTEKPEFDGHASSDVLERLKQL